MGLAPGAAAAQLICCTLLRATEGLLPTFGPPWLISCKLDTAEGAPAPEPGGVGAAEPAIATLALAGVATAAPELGLDSATANDLVPVNGTELFTGTEKLLVAVSPLAHC